MWLGGCLFIVELTMLDNITNPQGHSGETESRNVFTACKDMCANINTVYAQKMIKIYSRLKNMVQKKKKRNQMRQFNLLKSNFNLIQ